jgi:hypothetical protein
MTFLVNERYPGKTAPEKKFEENPNITLLGD